MTDRLAFYESLIGKPYKIGARGEDGCFDCYGLARHIQNELAGIDMPDVAFAEPTTRAQAEAMLSHPERQAWEEIPEAEARELDLVLMGNVAKRDFHLGTYIVPATTGAVIHIDKTAGVVVDDLPALRASGYNFLRFFRRSGMDKPEVPPLEEGRVRKCGRMGQSQIKERPAPPAPIKRPVDDR